MATRNNAAPAAVSKRKLWPSLLAAILFLALLLIGGYAVLTHQIFPIKYEETIQQYAEENDLPLDLVYAVVHTESSFEPEAESEIGAKGLMQITGPTLDWVRFKLGETGDAPENVLFDPKENIRYGTFLLHVLIEEFESEETALAAYHAGRGQVKEWLEDSRYSKDGKTLTSIPFEDTAHYVQKVRNTRTIYKKLYRL